MAQKGPFALRLWQFKTAYIDGGEFPINDLGFLERHRPTLRTLDLTGDQRLDVDQVNQLRALESLTVDADGGSIGPLRLGGFPNLRHLTVMSVGEGADTLVIDWEGASALESVSLDYPTAADVTALGSQLALRHVSLSNPPALPQLPSTVESLTLEGRVPAGPIGALSGLASLSLVDVAGLQDLSQFAGAGALAELDVVGVSGLRSLEGIHVRPGATVMLEDCPDLADISQLVGVEGVDLTVVNCPLLPSEVQA